MAWFGGIFILEGQCNLLCKQCKAISRPYHCALYDDDDIARCRHQRTKKRDRPDEKAGQSGRKSGTERMENRKKRELVFFSPPCTERNWQLEIRKIKRDILSEKRESVSLRPKAVMLYM